MPYEYFPATMYDGILVTDILKKFRIADKIKKTVAVENYTVKEEDSPETLAYLLYGDTTLSWVVLMLNEIKDRNSEWPYTQHTLNKIINEKYGGSSLFLRDADINFNLSKATRFVVGSESYDIKSIDRNLNKIVTSSVLPLSVTQGDSIVFFNQNQTLHTGSKTIRKVVYEDRFSLHHFEENNYMLDPRGMRVSVPYNEIQTYLYKYIIGDQQDYVVSNFQYELNLNDSKRDILLLNPDYLQLFLSNIKRLFQNSNKNINVLDDIVIDLSE